MQLDEEGWLYGTVFHAALAMPDPALNAVIHQSYERARKEARGDLPDGPLRASTENRLRMILCAQRSVCGV